MELSPALTCYIRGCPNEFGVVNTKDLLFVCTSDDIQCKAWLAAIPKASLRDVDDKLCLCSLHFENGLNVGGDSLPTIFPPVPATSEIITDEPLPPAPIVPPIKIKEEPVDDYEQMGQPSSEIESSENIDSLASWENDESSMEVGHVTGTSSGSRGAALIPPHKIKKEVSDSNEAGTSSSTQDSTSVEASGHFLQFVTSYVVKNEPHDDSAEVAAPPPGSGCGVVETVDRSSAFEVQEEFGEILLESIKTEEENDVSPPLSLPSTSRAPLVSFPSTFGVTIKTEPPDEVVTNGFGGPSASHDQGCQADSDSSSTILLLPPGFISEPPGQPSSVASGPAAFVSGNAGVLTGDAGFVISDVYSVAGGQQECVAEDVVHCSRCVNGEGRQMHDKSTCTNLPTRTVWTQTVEPDKRTVWTQVAQLGDLRTLTHRATQTDPWLERSPRLPTVTRRKRRYEDDDDFTDKF
ncbi:uncharacterized protein LOC144133137 [Amblyomma americanum]